jgi:DNA modification methylase
MKKNKLQIEHIPINEIILYSNNPRKNVHAIPHVKASIAEFGFINPCVIDDKNVCVAGHTRIASALELGMDEVPVIRASHLTPAQVKAYRIAENKTYEFAEWDIDKLIIEMQQIDTGLFTGFSDNEIADILRQEEQEYQTDEEDVPRVPDDEEVVSKEGDLWTLGHHRVICGDSNDPKVMNKLVKKTPIHLYWTDPPYGISYDHRTDRHDHSSGIEKDRIRNDSLTSEQMRVFLQQTFKNASSVMNEGAVFYITLTSKEEPSFRTALDNSNLYFSQSLIWLKDCFNLTRQDFNAIYESIYYGWKKGKAHYFCEDYTLRDVWDERPKIDEMKKEEAQALLKRIYESTDVIEINKTRNNNLHPTMKPVALIEKCINYSSKPNQNVLDSFGGSGSTLIASEKTHRNAFISEIEPKYVDVIIKRWQDFTGLDAVLEDKKTFNQIKRERLDADEQMIGELLDVA